MKTIVLCWLLLLAAVGASAQQFVWVKTGLNNSTPNVQNYSAGAAIAQANGRLTTTGYFYNDLTLDGQPLTGQSVRNAYAGAWLADGRLSWLQAGVGPANVAGTAVGLDAAGNSYVAYYLRAPATFDSVQVQAPGIQNVAVLVKYNIVGQVAWARRFIAGRDVRLHSVAVAADGTCTVGGEFGGTLALPGQPALTSGPAGTFNAGLLARFDASGTCQWSRMITGGQACVKGVALDAAGNIWASGGCGGNVNFGNGISLLAASYDGFLAFYNSQGVVQWTKQFGSAAIDEAVSVAVTNTGDAFVCGTFGNAGGDSQNYTGYFGSFAATTSYNSGYADGFLAKYDAQGVCQWVRTLRGADNEFPRAVAVNQRGEVYLGGAAYGGVQFETSTLPAATFGYQGFVAKYSGTGALRWLRGYGGSGTPFGASNQFAGQGLTTDGAGRVYVCGAFMGNTSFGSIYEAGPNAGVNYPYVAALDDLELVTSSTQARRDAAALTAFPNPSPGQVQLQWPATPYPQQLTVLDALGRMVHAATLPGAQATATLQLGHLPKGVYVLRLAGGPHVMTRRLVLE